MTGNRFQLQAADGKPLYAATVRLDPRAQPAAIDFAHTEGTLKGKAWQGMYALDGDTLTVRDNAPNLAKGRPAAFDATAWLWVCPHHVQARDALNGKSLGWPAGGPTPPEAARVVQTIRGTDRDRHAGGWDS